MPAVYQSPFRKSAMRSTLWGGMEVMVLLAILYICLMTWQSLGGLKGIVTATVVFSVLSGFGRMLAKYDPKFISVHRASFAYRDTFYSAYPELPNYRRVRR